MTQQTKIEWCDFTVNFWLGCQKVGPGCDNCYAEGYDKRFNGGQHWGPGARRRKVKGGPAKLRKIQREALAFAEENGHLPRAFLSSLCDLFDNAVDKSWRTEAFTEIEAAFRINIIMLTKRVGNVFQMVPPAWVNGGWPRHVGLMITVVNQTEADRDIPKLLDLKAKYGIPWVGLSAEPLLGPVDVTQWLWGATWPCEQCTEDVDCECGFELRKNLPDNIAPGSIDWIICGGESGPNARPMHPDWARRLRDQCKAAGTAFFFKQWGEWLPWEPRTEPLWSSQNLRVEDRHVLFPTDFDLSADWDDGLGLLDYGHAAFQRIGKKAAGRLLDGREHNGFPTALMGGEG